MRVEKMKGKTNDNEGNGTALLIVDVQNAALEKAFRREKIVENLNAVQAKARAMNVPIIFVQHADDELVEGSEGWKFVKELDVENGDRIIPKRYNSAFEETCLETVLHELRISKIVLGGAATNWCIRATAYGALDRGYDVTLIRDGHTTESIELGNGKEILAADIIMEFNIAMSWLKYPGRINEALLAKEIEF